MSGTKPPRKRVRRQPFFRDKADMFAESAIPKVSFFFSPYAIVGIARCYEQCPVGREDVQGIFDKDAGVQDMFDYVHGYDDIKPVSQEIYGIKIISNDLYAILPATFCCAFRFFNSELLVSGR
jgi:hypothetical protein